MKTFDEGYKCALELDEANTKLSQPSLSKKEMDYWRQKIKGLDNYFTPGSKRAVIERDRTIAKAALNIFRQGECTIADLLKQLYKQGVLCRTYKAGGRVNLSEREARDILQRLFGARKPGRPPGKKKADTL